MYTLIKIGWGKIARVRFWSYTSKKAGTRDGAMGRDGIKDAGRKWD